MASKPRLPNAIWSITPEFGTLGLVGRGNIVEMQHRMTIAVEPCARKVERGPRAVHETKHLLVETNGTGEISGGDVVVVEHDRRSSS